MSSIIADWIAAIAGVSSALIAIVILYEAIQIKNGQTVQKHNLNWNDFNKLILDGDNFEVYNKFLYRHDPGKYQPSERVNWIVFCWLNILEAICIDIARNQMPFQRGYDIVMDQLVILAHRKEYILELMKDRGYSNDTIFLFESFFADEDKAMLKISLREYRRRLNYYYRL